MVFEQMLLPSLTACARQRLHVSGNLRCDSRHRRSNIEFDSSCRYIGALVRRSVSSFAFSSSQEVKRVVLRQSSAQGVQTSPTHWKEHLEKLAGAGERRSIEEYMGILGHVNDWDERMQCLSDESLRRVTKELKEQIGLLGGGRDVLMRNEILSKAFAAVREASRRVLGMKHYDVQVLGGIALSRGTVAEMLTGEGKTLVAILPAYLYALEGKGSHIITVNDYLAQRDAEWVGKVLEFLGMSVGVVTSKTPQHLRANELAADVTYLTAYELAFMYLQDNSAPPSFPVALNRPLNFAVVDEVDSILIDEARNPFIVNMPGTDTGFEQHWMVAVQIAMQLQGPPVPENMNAEDLMNYFDGIPMEEFMNVDFIPDFRIKGTTITRKGMAKCVKLLAHPHVERVFIAQDGKGAYYSIVIDVDIGDSHEDRARSGSIGRLIIREVDQKREGGKYLSPKDESEASYELENASKEYVLDTLEKAGLTVMHYEEISEEIWDAAIPAVLWSGGSKAWGRFMNQATRAVHAFHRNIDYIVRGGEIVVIDSATGRERDRSRWQAGLHQALEAKELFLQSDFDLKIRPEDFDQGRITYQVLFSEYQTLSGMTGTAATEAEEFEEAYGLSVVRIPPHKPSMRIDDSLEVYGGKSPWSQRILDIVKQAVRHGRPVLIGTMSVEASEEVHRIISNAPFDIRLSEKDLLIVASALSKAPKKLPPPPNIKELDGDQTSTELKSAYIFYQGLMTDYDEIISYMNRCCRSKSEVPLEQGDVRHAMVVLRNVVSSKAWSLKNSTELDAVEEIYEILEHSITNSALSKSIVINLLNARPERARKEAEIIAQAGLPGTITVATSMAGRGTDILLGGNPKGLALSALKFLYGDIFVSEAEQGCFADIPLSKSHPAFIHGERSMKMHLPQELFESYAACKLALEGLRRSPMSENDASAFFEKVVEKTEIIRSHMKISLQHQLENAGDGYLSIFSQAFDAGDVVSDVCSSQLLSELDLEVPHEKYNTLIKFSLLQWLWFDRVCAGLAQRVRSSGGLCVVIASIPESRRAELQLRGRAGRQGDPGTTSIVASLEDPILSAALLPNQQRDIWNYIEDSGSSDEPLPSLVINPIIKTVTRNQEQLQQGGRDVARKYDAVIDSYRRHVYRLRRIITRGGEISRASLLNGSIRDTAADIVQANCDPESGIKDWDIEATIDDLISLLQQPALMLQASHENFPRVSNFKHPESACISTHVLDEFLIALVEETEVENPTSLPLHMQVRRALQTGSRDTLPNLNFKHSSISMTSMRRKAILSVRSNLKTPKNAHDALVLWAGDVLTSVYEAKRHACHEALTCSELTNAPLNAFQSNAIVRVWERDIALACIDSLWSDFLQDVTVLQAASQSRAFSMFDPVDEFRLEAATAFTRLLREYSHIVSSKLLGPVDLLHLRYLESSGASRSHAARQQSDKEDIRHVLKMIESS